MLWKSLRLTFFPWRQNWNRGIRLQTLSQELQKYNMWLSDQCHMYGWLLLESHLVDCHLHAHKSRMDEIWKCFENFNNREIITLTWIHTCIILSIFICVLKIHVTVHKSILYFPHYFTATPCMKKYHSLIRGKVDDKKFENSSLLLSFLYCSNRTLVWMIVPVTSNLTWPFEDVHEREWSIICWSGLCHWNILLLLAWKQYCYCSCNSLAYCNIWVQRDLCDQEY